MEKILINKIGNVRREVWQGRNYLVAPMTIIVPGVLPGSEGPIYYSAEETSKDPSVWNGMPIVNGHPTDENGEPLSARKPEVLNKLGLGFIFNTQFVDDKLVTEGWFDEELCNRVDRRILNNLLSSTPTELSTGLFIKEPVLAPEGANYEGIPYYAEARGYVPDHLAVLLDEVGACSLKDGCGVLINKDQRMSVLNDLINKLVGKSPQQNNQKGSTMAANKLTPAQRQSIVANLTKNCECWKGDPKAKDTLLGFTDTRLIALNKNTSRLIHLNKLIANADGADPMDDIDGLLEWLKAAPPDIQKTVVAKVKEVMMGGAAPESIDEPAAPTTSEDPNAAPNPDEVVPNEDPNATPAPEEKPTNMSRNSRKPAVNRGPMSEKEWLAMAPQKYRDAITDAAEITRNERQRLLGTLTANCSHEKRIEITNKYKNMSLGDLRELVSLIPTNNGSHGYQGATGVVDNSNDDTYEEEGELLLPPTINYAEVSASNRTRKAQ